MKLKKEFEVESDLQSTWDLLGGDLQEFVPCFPGAYFMGQEGDDLKVGVKVKIGVIKSNFRSTVRFVELDKANHTAVIKGSGVDERGNGKASATINTALHSVSADRTRVIVNSDVAMTGRIAQFGGPIIEDVADRLIDQFTINVNKKLIQRKGSMNPLPASSPGATDGASSAVQVTGAAPAGQTSHVNIAETEAAAEALDLGSVAGPVLGKYALKFLLIPVVFFGLGWLARGLF